MGDYTTSTYRRLQEELDRTLKIKEDDANALCRAAIADLSEDKITKAREATAAVLAARLMSGSAMSAFQNLWPCSVVEAAMSLSQAVSKHNVEPSHKNAEQITAANANFLVAVQADGLGKFMGRL